MHCGYDFRTDPLNRRLHGVDAQGEKGGIEVIESAGKQIGIDRRKFESGVA